MVAIIIVNELFIFGGCFAPYCLMAALPHTGVIAALVTYFMNELEKEKTILNGTINHPSNSFSQLKKDDSDLDNFEDTKEPYCPKCGSVMILRTAKKGKYSGQTF